MTNTIMTAKNTFAEGLVMDFAPDNTQATTLTSALNATLLTFNGNEMSLQNDMGNGRVETAYLPEGYVPVGTCEFGDIIYIVSYNPITNKSQIGCFPSPERNISSEEIGGMGQSLKWTDFQGSNGSEPNGELVASSVKKILYGTKDMTSGDKYIIYSAELDSKGNHEHLSDYGNTSHQHERFPKLVKIHVVSIEESGKITYLDSSTKWYKENDFYIQNSQKIVGKPDLDSYRTMVSSAYSVFSSKVSGKLALLIELEKITGFSCTWSAYTKEVEDNSEYQSNRYSIYWNFSWSTDNNNINPNAVVLTNSKWTGEDDTHAGKYQIWEKDTGGWALGGKNKNWVDGPSVPIAYPNIDYNYKTISRVYSPEAYTGTFQNFINSGSYDAQSKAKLNQVKQELGLSNVELIKANLSRKEDGTPDEGKYYFNCSSSAVDKETGKVLYYTNYNNELKAITAKPMSDDIINNTFNYPIVKHFSDFLIPLKQKVVEGAIEEWKNLNINNLIYYYELTPSMPYGLLREFSQDGYIDFKKIGTKSIELNSWRYYNYENTSTLTWGLEAYTEPNKGISEVVFLFYDNQGLAAAYHNSGKISYNGKFTEYFTLNTSGTNYKLNNKDEKNTTFYHKGESVSKDAATISNVYLDSSGKVVSIDEMQDGQSYYLNDAGTLYSNCLYLVKIIVKYCSVGVLDEYIEDEASYIEDFRWYWTNTMFNDYYYSTQDFRGLQFSLNLDCQAAFETVKDKWEIKQESYYANDDFSSPITSQNAFKSLSATVQFVNQDRTQDDNLRMAVRAGLQQDYNTFNLEEGQLSNINVRIFLANEYIQNYPEQPQVKFTEKDTTIFSGIYPTLAENLTGEVDATTSDTLNKLVNSSVQGNGDELYNTQDAYQNYSNNFHLSSSLEGEKVGNSSEGAELVYIDSKKQEETSTTNFSVYNTTLDKIYYDEANSRINENKSYPLTLRGIHYSKYYYYNQLDTSPLKILKSFVTNVKDLETYSMGVSGENKIQYTKIYFCSIREKRSASTEYNSSIASFNTDQNGINTVAGEPDNNNTRGINDDGDQPIHEGLSFTYDKIMNNFKFLFPMGFAYNNSDNPAHSNARKNGNIVISSNKLVKAGQTFGNGDLGGTLCGISVDGVIEPGDHMQSGNSLTYYVPIVLGYLTQLFYLSSDTGQSQQYYPYNYVYLSDNYSIYGRDVVIELQPSENIENNKLLVFRGWKYSEYLEQVINKSSLSTRTQEDLRMENNVNLKLYGCLRTNPLEIKIPYITPTTDTVSASNRIIVNSIYSDIPRFTTQSFTEGAIYYYNPSTKQFANVTTGYSLRRVSNYDILDGETIQTSFARNYSSFNIERVKRQLTLVNNQLALSQVPSSSTGTYYVKVTTQIRGDSARSLTGFYSGLKYYD